MPLANGSTPFALIRTAIVNRVATALNSFIPTDPVTHLPLSPSWIRPVANDDYEITANEPWFAMVRNYGPSPINSVTGSYLSEEGAGRLTLNISRRIRIYLYSRISTDIVGGDEIALGGENNAQTVETPPSWPSHDMIEDLVLNALINFVPTYTNGSPPVTIPLTLGPIHWLDSEDGPAVRPKENETGLVRSHLDFQVVYINAIDTSDPAPLSLPIPISNPT